MFVASTKVERRGASTLGDPFLWDDKFTAPTSRLAEIIRASLFRRSGSSGGIDHRVRKFSRMNRYGFQAPFAAQVKRGAGIAAMAVGLGIHGDRAEKTLQDGDAGLIGVAR